MTGSEQDPQRRSKQIEALKSANIVVMNNLPEAILLAKKLITTNKSANLVKPYPLLSHISVINAGLRGFAEDLQASNIPVVHYQWAPIAGGNKRLAAILQKLN